MTVLLTSISLSSTSATIERGSTKTLTVTYNPSNTTDSKTVTWSSSDEDIVTVDQTGLITGISAGTATVYATGGQGLMTSTEVKVTYGSVKNVSIKVGTNPITLLPLKESL